MANPITYAAPDATSDLLADLERDVAPEIGAQFLRVAADYFARTRTGDGPVSTPLAPADIARRFAAPLPEGGAPVDAVVERLARDVVADANRLYHPMYMGHQVSAPLPAAVWCEPVISALNQSTAVWEMSPTATIVETQVVRWMCDLVGYGAGAGGTMTTGGTEATFSALLAARAATMPDAWEQGVGAGSGDSAQPPVVVCGEHTHYAVTRAVGELGLGMRNVVAIPSRHYKLDVSHLVQELAHLAKAGRRVMAVVATAGTTATGSFDDLDAIGQLCEARGLWLHVDAAHGGSALLSERHRHRMRGAARARSVAWDPHKMMLLPLAAGLLLMKDERQLEAAFAQRAPYLFHGSDGERAWDQGVRSFLCSHRADAVKVWVALQRYGARTLGRLYDRLCDTARTLHEQLLERREFETLHEPESNILCFRWVGDRSLGAERLDALNASLRERYNHSGAGWITTTVLGGRRVLRVTIMNPRTTADHTRAMLDGLAREVKNA